MVLKKSDLYRSLWKSCDELRGGMDASQYKDYILTLLFVKYVSGKQISDRDSLIDVPEGGSFDDMVALKGDKEISPYPSNIARERYEPLRSQARSLLSHQTRNQVATSSRRPAATSCSKSGPSSDDQ